MSILIKGMDMPTSCDNCWFEYAYEICTPETGYENCPLVKIPPHGRLIDADVLKETMKIITRTEVQEIVEFDRNAYKVDEAPTIIEAEGESNGKH